MSKLSIEKYAAIDIGSNAIRLLIVTVFERPGIEPKFKKTSLVRVPIRLGEDVFVHGKISNKNYLRMVDAMNAFKLLLKTQYIKNYRACATSAMRNAINGEMIVNKILEQTGVKINIIDGYDEAALIASTNINSYVNNDENYLYVDVGGGSTEFTIYSNGKVVESRSFRLGTVRIINNLVDKSLWENVEEWIKSKTKNYKEFTLLGSGGNINTIYKNSGKKMGTPLSYFYLSTYYKHIKNLSYEERIFDLNMNPDRADVVIPATKIYLSAMKWSKAKNIYVPKIGLADGIIRSLYNKRMNQ
jgi:exopolyphosphatase/guanosine-5'-triphosphate,3'-diphosphate pyrophosphatase